MPNWFQVTRKTGLLLIIAAVGLAALSAEAFALPPWWLVKWRIHREFRGVPKTSTSELAQWLNDPARTPPLLLDVRTEPEFAVSHLAGAVQVDPESDAKVIRVPKSTPIVTYCSVGYRSAKFAERLQTAGYENVRNLDGSIFQWANENRPLVSGSHTVQTVHPYSRAWSSLLKRARRAPLNDSGGPAGHAK